MPAHEPVADGHHRGETMATGGEARGRQAVPLHRSRIEWGETDGPRQSPRLQHRCCSRSQLARSGSRGPRRLRLRGAWGFVNSEASHVAQARECLWANATVSPRLLDRRLGASTITSCLGDELCVLGAAIDHRCRFAWRSGHPITGGDDARATRRVGWPGGIAPPGSLRSRRDSLPSPGSSHQLFRSRSGPTRQWANRPGARSSSPVHHRLNRLIGPQPLGTSSQPSASGRC